METLRQADVVQRLLDRPHPVLGVAQEALARGREFRAVAAALEQARTERSLERMDAGADGRLGDVEAAGGGDEVAGRGHRQEGAGEFGVHGFLSVFPILDTKINR